MRAQPAPVVRERAGLAFAEAQRAGDLTPRERALAPVITRYGTGERADRAQLHTLVVVHTPACRDRDRELLVIGQRVHVDRGQLRAATRRRSGRARRQPGSPQRCAAVPDPRGQPSTRVEVGVAERRRRRTCPGPPAAQARAHPLASSHRPVRTCVRLCPAGDQHLSTQNRCCAKKTRPPSSRSEAAVLTTGGRLLRSSDGVDLQRLSTRDHRDDLDGARREPREGDTL